MEQAEKNEILKAYNSLRQLRDSATDVDLANRQIRHLKSTSVHIQTAYNKAFASLLTAIDAPFTAHGTPAIHVFKNDTTTLIKKMEELFNI